MCIQKVVLIGSINWVAMSIMLAAYHHLLPFCPLSGAITLRLHISPPTLGLPLVCHPKWGTPQHFVICPHMDHTVVYPRHPVLLGCPSTRTKPQVKQLHEWTMPLSALLPFPFFLGYGHMDDLNILFNNLCHHSRTNINAQKQVSTQSKVVIWIWSCFISKHYLFEPLELT